MALPMGTENKKQVYWVVGLFAVVLVVGGYELYGNFSASGATAVPAVSSRTVHPGQTAGTRDSDVGEAEKLSNEGIDPALHFAELAQSEEVGYQGTGRNIFSANSAPISIPQPKAPARPDPHQPTVVLPPPPPQPPAIDLKYFGYSQEDKLIRAFFVHNGDIFIAAAGQIVDHRYKVGAIRPGSVEVTDMGYNHTQTLPLTDF
jgi:hypothetical protein